METRWEIASTDEQLVDHLVSKLSITRVVALTLCNRGVATLEDARRFLSPTISTLSDPFLFKDMTVAVQRIRAAIEERERILVFGDYDADGVTGTALLVAALGTLGADVRYTMPDRTTEGYGMQEQHAREALDAGVSLVLTVDNGMGAFDAVNFARSRGVDTIVVDHHEPELKGVPDALAVLNPKRPDSQVPWRDMSGVLVAGKLVQALTGELRDLDLIALGTVADIVPLRDENRVVVAEGLQRINESPRLGVQALIDVAGLRPGRIAAGSIAFQLAPRLNATGRIGSARRAVELLLTQDAAEAEGIAHELDQLNRDRRQIEDDIFTEAVALVEHCGNENRSGIVLASDRWHPGVIGIVASRLVRRYYRPTVLIALKDGLGRGSARSIRDFDLHAGLTECALHLEGFGGHRLAAGLTVEEDSIPLFRDAFDRAVRSQVSTADLLPTVEIDALLALEDLDYQIVQEIEYLQPFGAGNRKPVFASFGVGLNSFRCLKEKHLKLWLSAGDSKLSAIGFNMGDMASMLSGTPPLDVAYTPQINEWGGRRQLELVLKDIKVSE